MKPLRLIVTGLITLSFLSSTTYAQNPVPRRREKMPQPSIGTQFGPPQFDQETIDKKVGEEPPVQRSGNYRDIYNQLYSNFGYSLTEEELHQWTEEIVVNGLNIADAINYLSSFMNYGSYYIAEKTAYQLYQELGGDLNTLTNYLQTFNQLYSNFGSSWPRLSEEDLHQWTYEIVVNGTSLREVTNYLYSFMNYASYSSYYLSETTSYELYQALGNDLQKLQRYMDAYAYLKGYAGWGRLSLTEEELDNWAEAYANDGNIDSIWTLHSSLTNFESSGIPGSSYQIYEALENDLGKLQRYVDGYLELKMYLDSGSLSLTEEQMDNWAKAYANGGIDKVYAIYKYLGNFESSGIADDAATDYTAYQLYLDFGMEAAKRYVYAYQYLGTNTANIADWAQDYANGIIGNLGTLARFLRNFKTSGIAGTAYDLYTEWELVEAQRYVDIYITLGKDTADIAKWAEAYANRDIGELWALQAYLDSFASSGIADDAATDYTAYQLYSNFGMQGAERYVEAYITLGANTADIADWAQDYANEEIGDLGTIENYLWNFKYSGIANFTAYQLYQGESQVDGCLWQNDLAKAQRYVDTYQYLGADTTDIENWAQDYANGEINDMGALINYVRSFEFSGITGNMTAYRLYSRVGLERAQSYVDTYTHFRGYVSAPGEIHQWTRAYLNATIGADLELIDTYLQDFRTAGITDFTAYQLYQGVPDGCLWENDLANAQRYVDTYLGFGAGTANIADWAQDYANGVIDSLWELARRLEDFTDSGITDQSAYQIYQDLGKSLPKFRDYLCAYTFLDDTMTDLSRAGLDNWSKDYANGEIDILLLGPVHGYLVLFGDSSITDQTAYELYKEIKDAPTLQEPPEPPLAPADALDQAKWHIYIHG